MRRETTKTLSAFLAWTLLIYAQQPPTQPPPQQGGYQAATEATKFSITSTLVIETVNVKDKSGKAIEGLTAKDFTITEDNVPQTIKFFEFQKLEEIVKDSPPPVPVVNMPPPVPKLTRTQIAPEAPGDVRYRDRRLIGLYFDLTSMPQDDQLRAFTAAKKFVSTQMTTSDLMCIMMFAGAGVQVLVDFTGDRDKLLSTIETMIVGEDENAVTDSQADTGAAFGQDDGEFNIFNTDRQLAALQTAAQMLARLNEKKALVYFASGLRLNGVDNQAQLQATINSAIRAGVSFWPVDARGLIATPPLGDATRGSSGGSSMYTGGGANMIAANLARSQDTLYALGADTGGKALLDFNDLSMGIVQAQKSVSSYYIIGYYTTNDKLDGKFHRIKITLNNGTAANLDYRQGYFAGKVFTKFTQADKERQLEDALMLGDPITELTIAMEVNYFQLNRAEYFVPMTVKIPGRELALARKGGAERTVIDFIGEIKDEYGTTLQNIRDKIDIKLSGSTAAELATRPIEYDTGFTLLPCKCKVKILARDAETGRIGTFLLNFTVPNLNKEEKRIPISSVVLSSQRVEMKDAIFNAKDKNNQQNFSPLVSDGQKLIPSVTRVFHKNRDMFVYLQAYQRAATTTQPLVAFVSFYRGQTKAFETPPLPVTDGLDPKTKAVPLRFSIPLEKLDPGRYDCQVTVLDPTGQKAAFWQAPVMLVP